MSKNKKPILAPLNVLLNKLFSIHNENTIFNQTFTHYIECLKHLQKQRHKAMIFNTTRKPARNEFFRINSNNIAQTPNVNRRHRDHVKSKLFGPPQRIMMKKDNKVYSIKGKTPKRIKKRKDSGYPIKIDFNDESDNDINTENDINMEIKNMSIKDNIIYINSKSNNIDSNDGDNKEEISINDDNDIILYQKRIETLERLLKQEKELNIKIKKNNKEKVSMLQNEIQRLKNDTNKYSNEINALKSKLNNENKKQYKSIVAGIDFGKHIQQKSVKF